MPLGNIMTCQTGETEVLAHRVSDNPETAHIEEGIKIKPVNVGV